MPSTKVKPKVFNPRTDKKTVERYIALEREYAVEVNNLREKNKQEELKAEEKIVGYVINR